jgi:hypothetical protein
MLPVPVSVSVKFIRITNSTNPALLQNMRQLVNSHGKKTFKNVFFPNGWQTI